MTITTGNTEQIKPEFSAGTNDKDAEIAPPIKGPVGNEDKGSFLDRIRLPKASRWQTGKSYRLSYRAAEKLDLKDHDKKNTLETLYLKKPKTLSGERLLELNQEDLDEQIRAGNISYITLDYKPDTCYRVSNRTKKPIALNDDEEVLLETLDRNSAKTLNGERLLAINQESLAQLIAANNITCKKLDYDQNTDYIIYNLTAKRISIKHNYHAAGLFLPAFGSRTIRGKTLLDHDFTDWENQGLIKIETTKEITQNDSAYAVLGLSIIVLALFLLISIPLALFERIRWGTVGIGAAIGVILMIIAFSLAGRNFRAILGEINSWLKLFPGITLVLASGIGLPVLIVYLFGDGQNLLSTRSIELASLGRLMQVGFVSIASMLPAFLFYLFGRQQVEKQKENFYREAMLLDPNVWSDNEAKNKYEPLLNSVFDTGKSPFSVLLLVISTVLLVMGWILTLSPIGSARPELTSLIDFFAPVKTPFTFGFLGAYFFTVNMIYRRYVRADLTTKTYAYITMRLLVTLVLVWAVGTLPQFAAGSALKSSSLDTSLFIVAFIIGIFPETGMALIQDQFKLITKQKQDKDSFSLTRLEGMNLYDRARLLEEGIENIENLAHHNLMELIARTRIPTPRLVDMFDQAILYLHLGEDNDSSNEDIRVKLRKHGIRTASDLYQCKDKIKVLTEHEKDKPMIERLEILIQSLEDDEWFNYIQSWRSYSVLQDKPIDDPFKFHEIAAKSLETS